MQICQGKGNTKGPRKKIVCKDCGVPKAETAFKWTGANLSKICRKCSNGKGN